MRSRVVRGGLRWEGSGWVQLLIISSSTRPYRCTGCAHHGTLACAGAIDCNGLPLLTPLKALLLRLGRVVSTDQTGQSSRLFRSGPG